MGKPSRAKGRRGECAAKRVLADRDYIILADTSAGISCDDLLVESPTGEVLSVEVKNVKQIDLPRFVAQARQNAKKRPWLLMAKLAGTGSWLVMGKGRVPVIWHEKEA